ncbi:hypothetical protein F5Y16DRAFT_399481 [Xylariaceae sp. FL0255]|nr:hypothetical protein F5Y16DRAFT_399481 [Xylariaceae sp. FL0255]
MAKDDIPSVGSLDKPANLDELLKQDRGEDCLPCRLTGGGAFLGLAAYSYYTGTTQLERQKAKILATQGDARYETSPIGSRDANVKSERSSQDLIRDNGLLLTCANYIEKDGHWERKKDRGDTLSLIQVDNIYSRLQSHDGLKMYCDRSQGRPAHTGS